MTIIRLFWGSPCCQWCLFRKWCFWRFIPCYTWIYVLWRCNV